MAYYERNFQGGNRLLPPVIQNLLIANVLLFLLQLYFRPGAGRLGLLEQWLALWPIETGRFYSDVAFYPWQVLTYGFLHSPSTIWHIGFNMLALWMFGRELEMTWGSKRFLLYYLTCVVGAALVQLVVASIAIHNGVRPYPTLGASGGVYGILLGFGMMFPHRIVQLIFPPVAMEARWFVLMFGGIELLMGLTRPGSGVAHFAHLGGMLFGLLVIFYWRGKLPLKPKHPMRW